MTEIRLHQYQISHTATSGIITFYCINIISTVATTNLITLRIGHFHYYIL